MPHTPLDALGLSVFGAAFYTMLRFGTLRSGFVIVAAAALAIIHPSYLLGLVMGLLYFGIYWLDLAREFNRCPRSGDELIKLYDRTADRDYRVCSMAHLNCPLDEVDPNLILRNHPRWARLHPSYRHW